MAYLAVNNPKTVYKILSTKMTDPPVPECHDAPPELWSRVLVGSLSLLNPFEVLCQH